MCDNFLSGLEGSAEFLVNSSVRELDLSLNCFRGVFPIPPLSIVSLFATGNNFMGNIPLSICDRNSLKFLDLSYNSFTGLIPQCLSNLKLLGLRKKNLEGSLPDMFSAGASLRTLDVGYNRLTGKLPRSLLNCSSLKFLSDQGPLAFPELRIFEISDNNFTGSLSPSYFVNWKASFLQMNGDGSIYMGYNNDDFFKVASYSYEDIIDLQYKGLFMEQSKVLNFYSAIDLSGNILEGQIPESVGLLKTLIALNLSNNAFTGHIPLSSGNLTELESLDMSSNQLSGTITQGLKTLSFLAFVNVSHNHLKGEIPQGTQITGQPKSSFEGNAGLCGLPLRESCFGTSMPPIQEEEEEDQEEEGEVVNWIAVAIGCAPGLLLGLAIGQVIASYKPEWLFKIGCPYKRRNR